MASAEPEYGCLAVARELAALVRLPDGEVETFKQKSAAEERFQELVDEELARQRDQVRRRREEFAASCTVKAREVKMPGRFTPNYEVQDLYDPDGERAGEIEDDPDRSARELAEERLPEPTRQQATSACGASVEDYVVWSSRLWLDGSAEQLDTFDTWSYGFPIPQVLAVLNGLADRGWRVAHVSEDRGIFSGATNATDSAVTRARFLLARDRSAAST